MAHLHVASAACVPLLRLLHFVVQRRTNIAAKKIFVFFLLASWKALVFFTFHLDGKRNVSPWSSTGRSCNIGGRWLRAFWKLFKYRLLGPILYSVNSQHCWRTCNLCGELQRVKDWQRSGQKPHEERPGLKNFLLLKLFVSTPGELWLLCHLMRHWLLGILPLPAPVDKGDQEERAPEDEVGHRDHQEHLHPHHPLLLHPPDVLLDVTGGRGWALLKWETEDIL